MSTLLDLKDMFQSEVRMNRDYRIWNESQVTKFINTARLKIQSEGKFDWGFNEAEHSFSTVASTSAYSLPTGFVRMVGNVTYDETKVYPMTFREFRSKYPVATDEGRPSIYYLNNSQISLYVVPNEVKTVRFVYAKQLADLSTDADSNVMSSDFDRAIVLYACYLAYRQITGKEQKGLVCLQDYEEQMLILKDSFLGDMAIDENYNSFMLEDYVN